MDFTAARELVKVATGGPELDGIVVDTPGTEVGVFLESEIERKP